MENNKNTSVEMCSASQDIFITKFSAWAPGVETSDEWNEWALGKREINVSHDSPSLDFTEAKFRRRLSQITKMTIHVVHDLLPAAENTKIFFLSFRGELSRQFDINKMLIEDNEISPAPFSLSVFNAPVALASIAFGLKGGYCAIYPGKNSFASGLMLAEAAFQDEKTQEIIFIYADEEVRPEYKDIFSEKNIPLAFALLLSRKRLLESERLDKVQHSGFSIPLSSLKTETVTPEDFLKDLILMIHN